jgi:polar amino acid transport system substrate-binding protein
MSEMKIRFWLSKTAAIMVSVLLTVTSVSAQDNSSPVLQRITKSQTLRVGMTGSQPPFNMKNRDGKLIGMDVDLANLLANSMGVKLKIVEMPFAKLLPALEDSEIDIVMSGMTSTLQRNVRVPFVGPYHITGISILTKSSTLAAAQNATDINDAGLKVAALRGSSSEDFVENVLDKPQLTTTTDHAEAVQLLLDGKVDAVVADGPACALSILRYPDAGLVTLRKPLTIEPIGIAIAPGDAMMINLMQNYTQALRATGALEAVQKKWFESGAWLAQVP